MISIRSYSEIDKHNWKSLVESSHVATWFQTDEAYRFYHSVSDMYAFAYGVVEEDKLVGVIVGYTTQEKCKFKQYFTMRAIVVGGPLLDENISESALATLLQTVKQQQGDAIYMEIRNLHDYSRWQSIFEANGFTYQPHLNIQVNCNVAHSLSEQRVRQVRKALKNGVKISQAQSEEEVKAWYLILKQLYRKKVRTPLWIEEFFLQFYRNGVGKYLLVKHEDKVIGGMMCPILEGKTIYEWYMCGLDEDFRECYPSIVATYAAIEYAKEHGLQLFDFMGAGKPDMPYGVRDFKMKFSGELVEHGRYLYIRDSLLYAIGKMVVKILKKGDIFGKLKKI